MTSFRKMIDEKLARCEDIENSLSNLKSGIQRSL